MKKNAKLNLQMQIYNIKVTDVSSFIIADNLELFTIVINNLKQSEKSKIIDTLNKFLKYNDSIVLGSGLRPLSCGIYLDENGFSTSIKTDHCIGFVCDFELFFKILKKASSNYNDKSKSLNLDIDEMNSAIIGSFESTIEASNIKIYCKKRLDYLR
jgi:hypothetical protein